MLCTLIIHYVISNVQFKIFKDSGTSKIVSVNKIQNNKGHVRLKYYADQVFSTAIK